MTEQALQDLDVDFVQHRLKAMQSERAYGEVRATFERGVMQMIEVNLKFKPPSAKKISKNS